VKYFKNENAEFLSYFWKQQELKQQLLENMRNRYMSLTNFSLNFSKVISLSILPFQRWSFE